jgi:transcriptional regulator NrdR family protein
MIERPLFGYDQAEADRRDRESRKKREPGMRCPSCGAEHMQVTDSRGVENGRLIRRRRKCAKCGERITTHEIEYGATETAVTAKVVRRAKRLLITLMEKLDEAAAEVTP